MTPEGTPGTRRVAIFARLSPTGGPMAAVALVVAVVLTKIERKPHIHE